MRRYSVLLLLILLPGMAAAADPLVEDPVFAYADWSVSSTDYRAGDQITVAVNVSDNDGRYTFDTVYANLSSPTGIEQSFITLDRGSAIDDGHTYAGDVTLDRRATTGEWNLSVHAIDQDGNNDSNWETFTVHRFDNVTLGMRFNLSANDAAFVDGVPAANQTYTASDITFPYVVSEGQSLFAGLVNYGQFKQLTFTGLAGTADQFISMTQDSEDNLFLLPFTLRTHTALETHESGFIGDRYGPNGFLTGDRPNLVNDLTGQATIRLILDYARIALAGTAFRLGIGTHTMTVRNNGVENGTTVVEVDR